MLFTNKITGKMIVVQDDMMRQKRLERRLRMFWRAMDGHTKNVWMVTLTYRHDVEWEKNHIRKFTNRLKEESGYKAYCWVAEVQPNTGRVHYHLIVFGSRPAWVTQRWGKGRTQVRKCWSIGYLLKYMWKGKAGEGLPKGARRFGIGVKKGLLCSKGLQVLKLSRLPEWVASPLEMMGGVAEKLSAGRYIIQPWGLVVVNEWRAW